MSLEIQDRKEVSRMQKHFEAPVVTLIGQAHEIVMGASGGFGDLALEAAPDFEFEQDSL